MAEPQVLEAVVVAIRMAIVLSLPFVLVGLIVGIVAGIFQAGTSIQDPSIGLVPRLVAVGLTVLIIGSWVMSAVVEFAGYLLSDFSFFIGRG